ncbi:MAG TPA: hypothetical protein VNO43_06885 [Candidatus Eisenbacteria bacterium]|nr:hypothetical protein [Candidatus Eisenbacteria bacterium]
MFNLSAVGARGLWIGELAADRAIAYCGSLAFALVLVLSAFLSHRYGFISDDGVFVSSALLAAAVALLAAIAIRWAQDRVPSRTLWGFSAVVAFLGIVNVWSPEIQPLQRDGAAWARMLNLTLERNFPTLFSSYLLGMTGVMAWACRLLEMESPKPRRDAILWSMISVGFVFLAFDETLMFHEKLNRNLREWIYIGALRGNYWTLVYVPIALAALSVTGRFFYRRFAGRGDERALLVGGVVLWMAVPALEVAATMIFREQHQFKFAATLEEVCEMCGSLLFMMLFAAHAARMRSELPLPPSVAAAEHS